MATPKNSSARAKRTPWAPTWTHEAVEAEAGLQASIRQLNHVFGRYRGEDNWHDPLDDLSRPRAQRPAKVSASALTEEEVAYFFPHGICVYDPKHQRVTRVVKYFLPRAFEGAVRLREMKLPPAPGMAFDWWFIVEQMNASGWKNWPAAERQAVEAFFAAWWPAIVGYRERSDGKLVRGGRVPSQRSAQEFLQAAAGLDIDPTAMLALWRATPTGTAALQLIDLIAWHSDALLATGYLWPDTPSEMQGHVVRWLLQLETTEQLRQARQFCADEEDREYLDKAIERLGWVITTWQSFADRSIFPAWVRELTAR